MRRDELSDEEWAVIAPLLPTNTRGIEWVDDRRAINGIHWRFRPAHPGVMCLSAMVCARRSRIASRVGARLGSPSRRCFKASCWRDRVMIDSFCVSVHQHGANVKKGFLPILA